MGDLAIGPLIWILVLFGVFASLSWLACFFETRCWNRGRCRDHNERWNYFDTDSQGGRGYKCARDPLVGPRCMAWISWPGVDS